MRRLPCTWVLIQRLRPVPMRPYLGVIQALVWAPTISMRHGGIRANRARGEEGEYSSRQSRRQRLGTGIRSELARFRKMFFT
jgi:hypothetical protein